MIKNGFKLLFTDDDNILMGIESLAVFSNEADDPYMTNKDDADSEEEEDFNLLPTDNLVAVGHVEGDAAILEVYGMKTFTFVFTSFKILVFVQFTMQKKPICTSTMKLYFPLSHSAWNGSIMFLMKNHLVIYCAI